MKIQKLQIENFLALRDFEHEFTQPITLFCGPNACGKSSIGDAVRFAVSGEPGRGVVKKKDLHMLLSLEAKSGKVYVTVDPAPGGDGDEPHRAPFTVGRNVKTGKALAGTAALEDKTVPYLLDAGRFAALPPNERRTFLFGLMGVDPSTAATRQRMIDTYGCNPALVETIIPILRQGFPATCTHAEGKRREAKGAWRGVTSENYGADKAEGWVMVPPPVDGNLEEIVEFIARNQSKLGGLQQQRGEAKYKEAAETQRMNKLEQYQKTAALIPHKKEEFERHAAELTAMNEEIARLEQATSAGSGTQAEQGYPFVADVGHCYKCNQDITAIAYHLVFDGNALRKARPATGEVSPTYDADMQALGRLRDSRPSLVRVVENRAGLLETAKNARPQAELLKEQAPAKVDPGLVADLNKQITELQASTQYLENRKQGVEAATRVRDDAANQTAKALAHHKEAQAWELIIKALSPDGIPGALLAEAIGPINERLAVSAKATGWRQVVLSADMDIVCDGRQYGLLSESEKWWANAMIAEAISSASGSRLLVLDKLDVLDLEQRSAAMMWLHWMVSEYDTIILMATLKEAPKRFPAEIDVVWMGP